MGLYKGIGMQVNILIVCLGEVSMTEATKLNPVYGLTPNILDSFQGHANVLSMFTCTLKL